jgi:hypothetical protein
VHLPIAQNLDPACVKAVLIDEVITLVEDAEKVAAKAQSVKQAAIAARKAALDADIETQQIALYGTALQTSALATHASLSDIEAHPEMYVPLMFPSVEAAQAYIAPKMLASRQFAAWRFSRIQQFEQEKALILS